MKQRPVQITSTKNAPVYHRFFYGLFSKLVVFLLVTSFVIQPIERVHASDEGAPPAPELIDTSLVTSATLPISETEQPLVAAEVESSIHSDIIAPETSVVATVTDATLMAPTTTEIVAAVSDIPDVQSLATSTVDDAVATTSQDIDDVGTTTVTTVVESVPEVVSVPETDVSPDIATGTADIQIELLPEEGATTTALILSTPTSTGDVIEATASFTNDSLLQFEKNDCVAVADGSYYCKSTVVGAETYSKDGLYSKPDSDGDLELFFAHNGTLDQITFNEVDDSSPYFDSISNTIVWHRLLNDRYQIMSYDVQSGAESQLTTDTVNNMEPTRAGLYTVWQHWNADNWDILLYDGVTTKRITSVPEHDIAPKIRGNLVIWNRLSRDSTQTIELYDLTTGEYTSIADAEGGELSNPRMVLVYDAQFQNGDIVTKGYDVDSREITELTAIPVKIPASLPTPDTTGETRALIQVKSAGRDDSEVLTTEPKIDPPDPDLDVTTTATSSVQSEPFPSTLLIPVVASTTATYTLDLSATSTLEFTESDVLVPPFLGTSTTPLE